MWNSSILLSASPPCPSHVLQVGQEPPHQSWGRGPHRCTPGEGRGDSRAGMWPRFLDHLVFQEKPQVWVWGWQPLMFQRQRAVQAATPPSWGSVGRPALRVTRRAPASTWGLAAPPSSWRSQSFQDLIKAPENAPGQPSHTRATPTAILCPVPAPSGDPPAASGPPQREHSSHSDVAPEKLLTVPRGLGTPFTPTGSRHPGDCLFPRSLALSQRREAAVIGHGSCDPLHPAPGHWRPGGEHSGPQRQLSSVYLTRRGRRLLDPGWMGSRRRYRAMAGQGLSP